MNVSKALPMISVSLILVLCACTGEAANSSERVVSNPKIKLTLMIASPEDSNSKLEEELVSKHFADQYDITFKAWDEATVERTVKTSIASGEPLDLVMFWPDDIQTFVNGNLALDLTPYLEANNGEWKKTFISGALNAGAYSGKVYAVPNTPIYPMLEVNRDILDQAGVELSEGPITWDEFKIALATIKEKTGIVPLGVPKDWSSWLVRELFYSVWPDEDQLLNWSKGQISFTDPMIVKVFDEIKELYDKEYVYPGKGALTTTLDQVNSAFKSGKVAIKADINLLAKQSIKDSGLKNVQILSWPHMGSRKNVMGGSNGYMIPVNVSHPKISVEILKYLTSAEVLQHRVNNGAPVVVSGVKSDDPDFDQYAKDIGILYEVDEILSLSPALAEHLSNMPANYIFYGKDSLKELDKLRLEAIQQTNN